MFPSNRDVTISGKELQNLGLYFFTTEFLPALTRGLGLHGPIR